MEKQPYHTPILRRLGSVKEVTEGGTGLYPEAAGSFTEVPPSPAPPP